MAPYSINLLPNSSSSFCAAQYAAFTCCIYDFSNNCNCLYISKRISPKKRL